MGIWEYWNEYETQVLQHDRRQIAGEYAIHLIIQRRDREEVRLTWSQLQYIIQDCIGDDVSMYEVFPQARDVVNEVNKRHFWSFAPDMYLWRHL